MFKYMSNILFKKQIPRTFCPFYILARIQSQLFNPLIREKLWPREQQRLSRVLISAYISCITNEHSAPLKHFLRGLLSSKKWRRESFFAGSWWNIPLKGGAQTPFFVRFIDSPHSWNPLIMMMMMVIRSKEQKPLRVLHSLCVFDTGIISKQPARRIKIIFENSH